MLGPLMIDFDGTQLSALDRELLRHPLVGGVILFARNYVDPAQVAALCAEIHALREPRLLIAVDQEGGRVQRFRAGFTELPPLAHLGAAYDRDPTNALSFAADHAWVMAHELRAVGVDFSFAPVLDLGSGRSSVIGDRAFHADPKVVARLAQAYVSVLHHAGMAAVGKHYPGHGGVEADSHLELPVDDRDRQDLELADLLPFRALVDAGIEGMMTAHVLYPKVDRRIAGYSPYWIKDVLRGQLGFEGAVFSDDLSMAGAGIATSYRERALQALAAGCDVLLICNQRAAVYEVLDALPAVPYPQTQVRLMRMHARGHAQDFSELMASARWRETTARLNDTNPAPELALGDDNVHG